MGSVLTMRGTIKTSCFTGPAYARGIAGAEVDPSAGRRPRYSEGASANHLRGRLVPVEDQPARTTVSALGKRLRSDTATSRTLLRRAVGIHRDRMTVKGFSPPQAAGLKAGR